MKVKPLLFMNFLKIESSRFANILEPAEAANGKIWLMKNSCFTKTTKFSTT